ncbi:class I ribonucleotide reductase maintenance protein YfaE [Shewanella sp. YIC-542]|uniref:class I ribonucleotide reductase maintenance protein YfaE n=1 Tax=Shewanella mytili TaxID=3377111 RepID=UPI00398EC78F
MPMSSPTLIFKKAPIVLLQGEPLLLWNWQQPHPTLLHALEAKKVRIFSECRSGYCGSCRTRIRSGSVRYLTEPLAALADNECLPCCCVPEGDLDLELSGSDADMPLVREAHHA